jgi:hypothetical protein
MFSLTLAGKRKLAEAQPHWEQAERTLLQQLGDAAWKSMKQVVSRTTEAALAALNFLCPQ